MAAAPWTLGAGELAAAYRAGDTDPVALVRSLAQRIDRLDPELNAFTVRNPDLEAEAEDSALRLRQGRPRSALEGVPIAVKDNLAAAGMPASWGSAVYADRVCSGDELPVGRLRRAGALVVGKTNTPEFAVEGYTANRRFGVTRNPWNLDLTPGGSSGGSAAAVAAGLATAAIGTDGGGSIRRPAGHTGLYGLKPTIGSVPRSGGLPQILLDFEVVGPLARSAADLAALYRVLAGADRADPLSRRPGRAPVRRSDLRILYVERFADNPCDPAIRARVRQAADRLADLGHRLMEGPLPFDTGPLDRFWPKFAQIGLAALRAAEPGMAARASAPYLAMADAGETVPAPDLFAALGAIGRLRAAVSLAFADWDVIMTPTAAAQPWAADRGFPERIDGRQVGPRGHAVYTGWVNACGHPAVAVPAGPDEAGLPVGYQLIGDLWSEPMLLDLARAAEAAAGPWRWPGFAER